MKDSLLKKVHNSQSVEFIFCDYYDTIVHRRVHPLKPFKIWAHSLIKELNLNLTANELYKLRRSTMINMSQSMSSAESEISYSSIMSEIYHKLDIQTKMSIEQFIMSSYRADFEAEVSVQYLNKPTTYTLRKLKEEGYKIYCVSDFHADEEMLLRLMKVHEIDDIYDKIFVSASQNASKENRGLIFKKILEKENISARKVLMIGDNLKSDVINAKLHGIESYYLNRRAYRVRQKLQYAGLILEDFMGI